jgi:hypothetical protein
MTDFLTYFLLYDLFIEENILNLPPIDKTDNDIDILDKVLDKKTSKNHDYNPEI